MVLLHHNLTVMLQGTWLKPVRTFMAKTILSSNNLSDFDQTLYKAEVDWRVSGASPDTSEHGIIGHRQ